MRSEGIYGQGLSLRGLEFAHASIIVTRMENKNRVKIALAVL